MKHFSFLDKQQILSYTKIRRFETKLGERVRCISPGSNVEEALQQPSIKFVVFGIAEDIGVKANGGIGGTHTAWNAFLSSFLNTQSNDFLDGSEILILGNFNFHSLEEIIEKNAEKVEEKVDAYRHAVNTIDEAVEQLMHLITQNKKMPIIIGGGHNNSYPCIKGAAKGWHKAGVLELAQINAINLDAHADYRPMEGRHSGNGFRYADEDGYLEKYCVIGLHENYIQQNVWMDIMENPFVDCITYEDIYLHEKRTFLQAIAHAIDFTSDTLAAIELDVDSIAYALSSASSPVGFSTNDARKYVHYTAAGAKPAYLHICEAAETLEDGRNNSLTGKLLSYLVTDFLKVMMID